MMENPEATCLGPAAGQTMATAPTDTCLTSTESTKVVPPFSIRTFENTDYEGVSLINNRFSPYLSLSPRELQFTDRNRDPRCIVQRWVAHVGEVLAGYGVLSQSPEAYSPTRFQFQIYVLPEFEGKGIEEQLLKAVVGTFQHHKGASLRAVVESTRDRFNSVLDRAGFRPSVKFFDQLLELSEAGRAQIDSWIEAAPPGIRFITFAEFRSVPDGDRQIYELENRIKHDIPFPDELSMKFDYFQNAILENPGFLNHGSFIAMDVDRPIGLLYLFQRDENPVAHVRLTGVLPEYRKRGIALYLKALSLRYAAQHGFTSVFTRSEESNGAIYALNARVGFRNVGTHINWSRAF